MRFNSTIIPKKKQLACGCFDYAFSKNRCKNHATIEDTQKRISEYIIEEDGLPELIKELDALFSKYIRKKYADKEGIVECYTCGNKMRWQDIQNGHYVSRYNLFLRFDERNCRPQCENCNCIKHGNLSVFGKKLDEEHNGITELLFEESKLIYKPSREELKELILEFNKKINSLPIN